MLKFREENSRACWKTSRIWQPVARTTSKIASSWPALTDAQSGETSLPNSVRTDTWQFEHPYLYPTQNDSRWRAQRNRFVHRLREYRIQTLERVPTTLTNMQTSMSTSGTDRVCVHWRGAPVQTYWSTIPQYTQPHLHSRCTCTLDGGN